MKGLFMEDCVFCNIVNGTNKTPLIYQDDSIIAFPDLHPRAPIHILIIPKKHIRSLNDVDNNQIIIGMLEAATIIAKQQDIYEKGYRLVINTGSQGGQVIQHLHLHLIGGRYLKD
jgi:histidine triad (HIT) family protein